MFVSSNHSPKSTNPNPSPTGMICWDWFGLYWFGLDGDIELANIKRNGVDIYSVFFSETTKLLFS